MIINLDSYRFYISRPEEAARSNPKTDYEWVAPLHNEDTLYFYIEVLDGNNFSVFDPAEIIPPDVMESIQEKKVMLAIANSGHGYHELVGDIYTNIVFKYQIDPKQILLISESADIHLELEAVATKYNVEKCKLQWSNEFDKIIKDQIPEYANIKTLEHKEYSKKFLSWNGMFRPHRTAMIYLLECYDLLKQGYVSYNIRGGQPDDVYEWIYDSLGYNEEFKKLIEDNADKLMALPEKIFIDDPTVNLVTHPGDSSFYENTYFSLVTETSFPFIKLHYGNFYTCLTDVGRILSEKIFKPIGLKHPFIVVSNPRTLELLRSLGYKTFSPYIDESYDLIEDDSERLLAIVKETKRLCDLNGQELAEFLDNCKEICEYNREVMLSKTITNYRHTIIS